jgi:hypothetical protein
VPVQRDVDPSLSTASDPGAAAPSHDRPAGGAALPRSTRAQAIADAGTATGGARLPHLDPIQRSFGHHDVSGVEAHVGGDAAAASSALGARAYATGNRVAFGSAPDLHLAAHEAAHVVQQRGGVYLKDGLGDTGDVYERHADEVADAVVRGEPAQGLLDRLAPSGGAGRGGVGRAGVQRRSNEGTLGEVFRYGGQESLEAAGFATSPYGEQKQNFLYAGHAERFAFLTSGIEPRRAATLLEQLNVLDAFQLLDRLVALDPAAAVLRAMDRAYLTHGISTTGAHPLGIRIFLALPRLEKIAIVPRLEMLDSQRELLRALGTDSPVNEILRALPDDRLTELAAALGDAHMARLYVWQDGAGRARFARLFAGADHPAMEAALAADVERNPGGATWSAEGADQDARLDDERMQDPGAFAASVARMAMALQQTSADEYVTAPEDKRRSFLRKQPPPVAAMYLAMDPGNHASMLRVFVEPAVMAKVLVLYMQSTGRRSLASSLSSDELLAVVTETSSATVVGDLISSLPADQMMPVLPALDGAQLGRVLVRATDPHGAWRACRAVPPETLNHALSTLTLAEATRLYLALTATGRAEMVQVLPPELLGQLVLSPEHGTAD